MTAARTQYWTIDGMSDTQSRSLDPGWVTRAEYDALREYAEQLNGAVERAMAKLKGHRYISGHDANVAEDAYAILGAALSKNTTDQAGSAKAAGAPGAESTAAPTITHLIAWLDAKGAASTVCKWGDSPGTTIRALLEEYAREKAVLGVRNSAMCPCIDPGNCNAVRCGGEELQGYRCQRAASHPAAVHSQLPSEPVGARNCPHGALHGIGCGVCVNELVRDGRRYRFLRADFLRAGEYAVARYQDIPSGVRRYLDLSLDDVLDAAMKSGNVERNAEVK